MKVVFNTNLEARARRASQDAAKAVFSELNGRFQDAISDPVWTWPRQSKRGLGGETLRERAQAWREASFNTGSPRNIVDIGTLQQSNPGPRISGTRAEFRWGADYARWVHNGARIYPWGNRRRRVLIPGRPWTSAVLGTVRVNGIEPYRIGQRFKNVWLAKFKRS